MRAVSDVVRQDAYATPDPALHVAMIARYGCAFQPVDANFAGTAARYQY